ncbi:MAG: TonB family protein [Cryomorphaceae bacterium]|nr:MAG: TonB family protein [Cryomorphaceae bacterium]
MDSLIQLFFQANLLMAAGCILYIIVIGKQPFFQANRVAIHVIALLSFAAPQFAPITNTHMLPTIQLPVLELGAIYENQEAVSSINGWIIAYGLVTLILLMRLALGFIAIIPALKSSRLTNEGYRVVLNNKGINASFFGLVFLDEKLGDEMRHIILTHEKVHVRQFHSIDALIWELICALFWINPFVWIMRSRLLLNLEHIADAQTEITVGQGAYIESLVANSMGSSIHRLSLPFIHKSKLKNRIAMMQNKPTRKPLRYLIAAPLIVILALSVSQARTFSSEAVEQNPSDSLYTIVHLMPSFPGGEEAFFQFLGSETKYPEAARLDSIQGMVYVSFVIWKNGEVRDATILRGVHPTIDEEALRVVSQMPAWSPGKLESGEAVSVIYNLPMKFQLK